MRSLLTLLTVLALAQAAPAATVTVYGPLTYTSGDPSSLGGPYTFNAKTRDLSFTADNLSLRMSNSTAQRGHGLVYDLGFATNLSSYSVTTTHVFSAVANDRRGLLGYALDGVGAMGVFMGKGGVRTGSIAEDGTETKLSLPADVILAANQVQGDGTSDFNIAGTFDIKMDITDTGDDATSTFGYTFTQAGNVWQVNRSFAELIADGGATSSALIAAARDPGQSVGFAFYTFLDATNGDERFDDTSGGVPGEPEGEIPEPATLALVGMAAVGLGGYVRRRRRQG